MTTILHLIDTTGPGGAETVFVTLADQLRTAGFRSIPVIRGPGWVEQTLRSRGLDPVILPAKGRFNWRFLRALTALIREEDVHLVQSHLLGSNVYAALAGMLTRRPVVATFHGMVDVQAADRLRWLRRLVIARGASSVVCVSEHLKQGLCEAGYVSARKTTVIYNGIAPASPRDTEPGCPNGVLRQRLQIPAGRPLIGCLGNVRPAKGYDVLLDAVTGLHERGADCAVVIAGQAQGALADALLRRREALGLSEHVHFVGFQADVSGFLRQLDCFVLPSTTEGFSISTIEAMANGVPVVVTRSGGPEEIVTDEETGLLVEAGSARALGNAIERLMANRDLADRLARAGQAHAMQRFSTARMIAAYESIYKEITIA